MQGRTLCITLCYPILEAQFKFIERNEKHKSVPVIYSFSNLSLQLHNHTFNAAKGENTISAICECLIRTILLCSVLIVSLVCESNHART